MESQRQQPIQPTFLPPDPAAAEAGVLALRDGGRATLWRALPEDAHHVRVLLDRLRESERQEVTESLEIADADLESFLSGLAKPDGGEGYFVREGGSDAMVAFGGYRILGGGETAAITLAVAEPARGRGIATLLLGRLARLAAQHGVDELIGVAHAENTPLLEVFRQSGFAVHERRREDYVTLRLSTRAPEHGAEPDRVAGQVFTAASLRPFLHPRAVAVVGASRDKAGVGHRILESLIRADFNGTVYPVNPKAEHVRGMEAHPSVSAIGKDVDLAVIAVPADIVPDVVDDCAEAGVRALIVISAGFAETGDEGRARQRQLRERVREHGMRMVGPNCLGLLHTDPDVRLNASFAPRMPPAGTVALCSQSGALGIAVITLAHDLGLGLSAFVSVGNKADISSNDLLEYWEEDRNTDAILLYLESFGNPARFSRIARRVARRKPVIAVKSGRTRAGGRAASSHTAALTATDTATDALFRQTGVIRADTLDEMFGIARPLTLQPLPRGRRVAIVTNSGGPGILCADALERSGLEVVALSDETRSALGDFLPEAAATANPVDMIATAGPDTYRRTVATVLAASEVDALVVIYTPIGVFDVEEICGAVVDGVRNVRDDGGAGKPVLASVVGGADGSATLGCQGDERIPAHAFPEEIGRILGCIADYRDWRASDPGVFPDFDDQDIDAARRICSQALDGRDEASLGAQEARDLLAAAGLQLAPGGLASSADQAARIADDVGYPVAAKLASREIQHKTDIGAVQLGLDGPDQVRRAFHEIERRVKDERGDVAMEGVLVQPLLSGSAEVMIGVQQDPQFGPLLAFGLGGIHVELLRDVAFRLSPLTDRDAAEMIGAIQGYPLLQGYRGHPAADIDALHEALLRISTLVEAVPALAAIDLNPIFALEPGRGYRVVDAAIQVRDRDGAHRDGER